ncbi:MAG: superoxide dismutase [Clostridia bacterium]|nr:superoxide dismutase [Clostridia bacterium]
MSFPYELKPLPYAYNALVPEISEETLHFHHDKHLKTYVENLNKALESYPDGQKKSLEELLRSLDCIPEANRTAIRNNGGGVHNHELYFDCMSPKKGQKPAGALAAAMDRAFGSYDEWKARMKAAALGQFGSGYAFLVCGPDKCISVVQTANQDSPLSKGLTPLLNVDIWEHAYYLDYQNLRASYVDAWFNVVNWEFVCKRYEECR